MYQESIKVKNLSIIYLWLLDKLFDPPKTWTNCMLSLYSCVYDSKNICNKYARAGAKQEESLRLHDLERELFNNFIELFSTVESSLTLWSCSLGFKSCGKIYPCVCHLWQIHICNICTINAKNTQLGPTDSKGYCKSRIVYLAWLLSFSSYGLISEDAESIDMAVDDMLVGDVKTLIGEAI